LYVLINVSLIVYLMIKIYGKKDFTLFYVLSITLLSGGVFYCIIRGNIMLTVFVFFLAFYYFYESDSKLKQEISLVFLAFTIVMKIYTVVFALILLKDKKYLAFVKAGVYSIVLFVVPMLFIKGGFVDNMKYLIGNALNFNDDIDRVSHIGSSNTSLYSFVMFIAVLLQLIFKFNSLEVWSIVADVIVCIFTVITLVALFKNKQSKIYSWGLILLLYQLCHNVSYAYTTIFFLLIFALMLKDLKISNKKNKIYFIITAIIMLNAGMFLFYLFKLITVCCLCLWWKFVQKSFKTNC